MSKIDSVSFMEQQKKIDIELSKLSAQEEVAKYCTGEAFSVIKAHQFLYAYFQCKIQLILFFLQLMICLNRLVLT